MLAAYQKNKKEIEKQGQASIALAKKRRDDANKRGLEAAKANLSTLKQKQTSSSNDPKGTAAASGAVSKGLQKRKDALSRQRKLDDLHNRSGQNGKISWAGLREKMNLALTKQTEEYQRHPKTNPLQRYSYKEVCEILEKLPEKEMETIQDALGAKNEDEVWDKINAFFTIGEN
jgi:Glu-tRNA(Gln) amidotransferase subunit E-like FAD-binding protein